jgi:hypothetical protein
MRYVHVNLLCLCPLSKVLRSGKTSGCHCGAGCKNFLVGFLYNYCISCFDPTKFTATSYCVLSPVNIK